MREDLWLFLRRVGRFLRTWFLPSIPAWMKPELEEVEPLIGETWGQHSYYLRAIRGKSRYDDGYTPDHYVFNGAGFHRRHRYHY